MIIIAILLIIAALDYIFMLQRGNVVIQHQFRLYALRDELRSAVIRGDVKSSNWVFQYLDSSLAKTIDVLPKLTIWRIAAIVAFSPSDEKMKKRLSHLFGELNKEANAPLAKIYVHFLAEMGRFISHRHSTCWLFGKSCFKAVHCGNWLKGKFRFGREVLTAVPETSTLPEFLPC